MKKKARFFHELCNEMKGKMRGMLCREVNFVHDKAPLQLAIVAKEEVKNVNLKSVIFPL